MNKKYMVSVITPVYNAEKYLGSAYRSLTKQTIGFENIEWIVVDDCSSDGSFELLKKMAAKHGNIKLFQTPKASGSASVPRNIALNAVTAEYVMFLDADDVYERDAAAFLLNAIEANDVDIADAAFQTLVGHSKKGLDQRYKGKREGVYDLIEDIDEWFPICHPICTKIFKTSIIQQNHLKFDPELRNGEDSLFLLQYMGFSRLAWHSNKLVYQYRIREQSVSHRIDKRYFDELLKTYSATERYLSGTGNMIAYEKLLEVSVTPSMDLLCDSFDISDEDCVTILEGWFSYLRFIGARQLETATAVGAILVDDANRNDLPAAKFHFFQLRKLYYERHEQLNEVFSSRGWKLVTAINRLLDVLLNLTAK